MINGTSADALVAERIERLLAHLWELRGTDLLLTAGAPPLVRVDGELNPVPGEELLGPADTQQLIGALDHVRREARPAVRRRALPHLSPRW